MPSLVDYPNPANEAYGWHFQFLTIIGLTLAFLTFLCGVVADLSGSPRVFFAKNALLFCSTPLEVLVTILYWGLRSVSFVLKPSVEYHKQLIHTFPDR